MFVLTHYRYDYYKMLNLATLCLQWSFLSYDLPILFKLSFHFSLFCSLISFIQWNISILFVFRHIWISTERWQVKQFIWQATQSQTITMLYMKLHKWVGKPQWDLIACWERVPHWRRNAVWRNPLWADIVALVQTSRSSTLWSWTMWRWRMVAQFRIQLSVAM